MTASSLSGAGVQESPWLQPQTNLSPRILVVDDDVSMRTINTKALLRSGYQVDAAEDGSAAWQALNAEFYDLMITDNKMPKVSGIELLKKLRASRMSLPVIMATGTLPTEEFTRYPWLQPDATLLKPYTIVELVGVVKEVLRATGGDREQIEPPPNWPTDSRLPF
jgi:two-component system alkaline phosphatase synthesis response regulator PhoP